MGKENAPWSFSAVKIFFTLFLSFFILKILYNRLIFGCLDLRRGALWELLFMPLALTACLWLGSRLMRIRIGSDSRDRQ